jgi:hypothetical protein
VITTSKSPDLQQALIELFTSAVAAVASRLDSLGLPSILADQRATVIREKNQIGLEHVPTIRNILSDFMTVQNGAPWLTAKKSFSSMSAHRSLSMNAHQPCRSMHHPAGGNGLLFTLPITPTPSRQVMTKTRRTGFHGCSSSRHYSTIFDD